MHVVRAGLLTANAQIHPVTAPATYLHSRVRIPNDPQLSPLLQRNGTCLAGIQRWANGFSSLTASKVCHPTKASSRASHLVQSIDTCFFAPSRFPITATRLVVFAVRCCLFCVQGPRYRSRKKIDLCLLRN